jgi:hypothetical protein
MSEIDKNLSEILETEYIPAELAEKPVAKVMTQNDADKDFDYARMTHYELIEKGNEALDGILQVAKESQHPRAYEVAATLVKNLSDMTDKLMVLQKQKRELDGPKEQAAPTQVTVDKAVFVGSTAELLKKIKNERSS